MNEPSRRSPIPFRLWSQRNPEDAAKMRGPKPARAPVDSSTVLGLCAFVFLLPFLLAAWLWGVGLMVAMGRQVLGV